MYRHMENCDHMIVFTDLRLYNSGSKGLPI